MGQIRDLTLRNLLSRYLNIGIERISSTQSVCSFLWQGGTPIAQSKLFYTPQYLFSVQRLRLFCANICLCTGTTVQWFALLHSSGGAGRHLCHRICSIAVQPTTQSCCWFDITEILLSTHRFLRFVQCQCLSQAHSDSIEVYEKFFFVVHNFPVLFISFWYQNYWRWPKSNPGHLGADISFDILYLWYPARFILTVASSVSGPRFSDNFRQLLWQHPWT